MVQSGCTEGDGCFYHNKYRPGVGMKLSMPMNYGCGLCTEYIPVACKEDVVNVGIM